MGQFSKTWEELNFSDNYIFCKVMKDKKLCTQMLEILLGFKVYDIKYIENEHPIDDFYETRGIRMDVFVKDSDKIYDIEMQTGNYSDLLLRARYYQSASDISSTPRRTRFKDLRETYIIFICKDDPFGENLPLYTEFKKFKETDAIPYDDKSYKLFYNSSAYAKAKDEDISAVLEFIYTLQAKSNFTRNLQNYANIAKAKPTFKDEYMYFVDVLEEEKEIAKETGFNEGRTEGLAAGLAEGLAEGKTIGLAEGKTIGLAEGLAEGKNIGLAEGKAAGTLEACITAIKKLNISPETASETFGIPLEKLTTKLQETCNLVS